MKRKITLLIIISVLGVIALSFIQGYLINNTYKLKKANFIEETKDSISGFEYNNIAFDTLYDKVFEHLVAKISDYKLNGLKKSDLLNDFESATDSVNDAYIQTYKTEFKKRNITYDLKFQRRLKSLVILEGKANDTLYFEPNNLNTFHFLGEYFNPSNEYITNRRRIETDYSTDYIDDNGEWQTLSFDFELTTENFINADDWNRIILGQMAGLFILSILMA